MTENEWIEKKFKANITGPVITEKEIRLIRMGFKVEPRRDPRQVPGSKIPRKRIAYVEAQIANGDDEIDLFGPPSLPNTPPK